MQQHTKNGNGAAGLAEHAHGADVLLGEGVLDCRDKCAGAGGDHGGLDGSANGILGLVGCLVLVGHGGVVTDGAVVVEWRVVGAMQTACDAGMVIVVTGRTLLLLFPVSALAGC